MRQTILSVVLPVAEYDSSRVEAQIEALRNSIAGNGGFPVLADLPGLHFLSMMVFGPDAGVPPDHAPVTPLFVLEANFDGLAGPFWAHLEAALGENLRELLRACTSPDSDLNALFASVTAPFSRVPMAPLFAACAVLPAASHRGNRGLSRARILRHEKLFDAVQAELQGIGPRPPGLSAQALHAALRAKLADRAQFGWLNEPWEPRISCTEWALDWARLVFFLAFLALAAAPLPWLLLGYATGQTWATVAALVAGLISLLGLDDVGDLATAFNSPPFKWLRGLLAVLLVLAASLSCLYVTSVLASLLLLLAVVRWQERRVTPPAEATPDTDRVRALQAWEDRQPDGADHMGSVVILKPGLFWAGIVRLAFRGVDLFVQVTGKRGYLGSIPSNRIMRTIHFAHWSFVDRGQRLMFLSNFDGSWESYLDDFIEKEHNGLTLAWSCGLGFPPSRYLSLDGATQGRQFKAWARLSMAPTRLYFAAYPNLTVNHVVRQARLAKGLCASRLGPREAEAWAKDL